MEAMTGFFSASTRSSRQIRSEAKASPPAPHSTETQSGSPGQKTSAHMPDKRKSTWQRLFSGIESPAEMMSDTLDESADFLHFAEAGVNGCRLSYMRIGLKCRQRERNLNGG